MFGSPVDLMFSVVPLFFFAIFIVVAGLVIFGLFKGIGQWRYNNSQPVLSVVAKVTAKRTHVSSSMPGDADLHHSHTTYFITFEVESRDRMEFVVNGTEYGKLADNDFGKLTFQGTRYLGFVRNVS